MAEAMKGNPWYYHKPGQSGQEQLAENRRRFRELRDWLTRFPMTREMSVALTNLQQAMMWSNAAIVLADPDAEALVD